MAFEIGPLDGISVLGGGSAFPALELTNEEVLRAFGLEGERLRFVAHGARETMGVWKRAWAHRVGAPLAHGSENTTLDLAIRAGRSALADSGLDAGALSLVLVATSTPHRMTASVAAAVGSALGARAACADVRGGCSAGILAFAQASLAVAAGNGPALVIGAETFSKIVPPESRAAALALADGAAALVVGRRDGARLLAASFETDGALGRLISTDGAMPPTEAELTRGGYLLSGAPDELAATVPGKYESAISRALGRAGLGPDAIDLFAPHQTSSELIAKVAARAGIAHARVFSHVERHANIGAAGWLCALVEARAEGRCPPGARVLAASVGGGMSWGALVLQC
jgi:3-oxoacyl-[acyl-carrier-protein] synthase-3